MQICARRNAFAFDLEAGSRPEGLLKFHEKSKAGLLGRFRFQQRSEGSAVDGADRGMIPDGKDQGLDIGAPACFLLQVETAGSGGLIRAIRDPFFRQPKAR